MAGHGRQGGYGKLDLRAAISSPARGWEFADIGKSVTDTDVLPFSTDAPATPGSYAQTKARPRSFAAELRYRW